MKYKNQVLISVHRSTRLHSKWSGSFCLFNNFALMSMPLSNNLGETSKQRRWLWSRGSLWIISLWRWQFFLRCRRRPISPNKANLITDSSVYVYHVVFDELLKDTRRHGPRIIVSKYPMISHRYWPRDRLKQVKYNKISQLEILNGDRVRLIELKLTVNEGTSFKIW